MMPSLDAPKGLHPGRNPQGGVNAYYRGNPSGISGSLESCRVWVESINSLKATALVRPDAAEGTRGRAYCVRLADIDFTREWKF